MLRASELRTLKQEYQDRIQLKLYNLEFNTELSATQKLKELDNLKILFFEWETKFRLSVSEIIKHFQSEISEYIKRVETYTFKRKRNEREALWSSYLSEYFIKTFKLNYSDNFNIVYSKIKKEAQLEQENIDKQILIKNSNIEIKTKIALIKYLNECKPNELYNYLGLETLKELFNEIEIKKNIGKLVEIDCCQDCDYYTIGNNRCSCGNRRISAYYEIYYNEELDIIEKYLTCEAY